MIDSSLCYIYRGKEMLLLHRVKKKNDPNEGKWVGIGGKFEPGETPVECVTREVREETGLCLQHPDYRGVVTFSSDKWEEERMHLFTADSFSGTLTDDCDEGVLEWVDEDRFLALPQWEGDKIFLDLLKDGAPFFRLTLRYEGDRLAEAVLDGKPLL